MISSTVKITLRNISRYRLFSAVNIAGLTIGMSCTLLLLMYVANELSYETFHKNRKRVIRSSVDFGKGENRMRLAGAMSALGPALKEQLPEVEEAVRFRRASNSVFEVNDETFQEKRTFYADASIFSVFSYHLIRGEPDGALKEPMCCVLTESVAEKYFGSEDPVGRSLLLNGERPLQITGVSEDCPFNTHLRYDILISYASLEAMDLDPELAWKTFGRDLTYLLLRDRADIKGIEPKITAVVEANTNASFVERIGLNIQRLKDIYMTSDVLGDVGPKGNMAYVTIFSSVAFLILIIACFNFINLSTARSIQRLKEVGIRKVLGAKKFQLVRQFLGESIITATVAIGLGMILFEILYPALSTFLQNPIDPGQQNYRVLLFFIPLLIAVVGCFAGAYPAFFLSRTRPTEGMKSILPGTNRTIFRKTGVLAQFTLAIILIIGTTVIYTQIRFMLNSDLGFDKENVVLVNYPSKEEIVRPKYELIRDTFMKVPGIISVSGTYKAPGVRNTEKKMIARKGASSDESLMIQSVAVDFDYLQAMGLRIAEGRNFSRDFPADPNQSVLLNETAARQYDLSVGEIVSVPLRGGPRDFEIVGIIADFHVTTFRERIEPMLLYIYPDYFYLMAVRIHPENPSVVMSALEKAWHGLFPDLPFNATYLEDTYNDLYHPEKRVFQLLGLFSCLAVFVASFGLFGLVTYTSERRNKEIGIRKVLGATVSGVTFMLMKNFGKWVILSNLIAWPAAYFIMKRWLEDYAYRIDLEIWMFFLAALLILCITMITAGVQALRAALMNPAQSLRYE